MIKEIDKNNNFWCYDIIKTPIVTEKYYGKDGRYAFVVSNTAHKKSIKSAIENIFKVDVLSVNVANRKGKRKRFKGTIGVRAKRKMAFIRLKKDQNIDLDNDI